jgi:hypothetical protein
MEKLAEHQQPEPRVAQLVRQRVHAGGLAAQERARLHAVSACHFFAALLRTVGFSHVSACLSACCPPAEWLRNDARLNCLADQVLEMAEAAGEALSEDVSACAVGLLFL